MKISILALLSDDSVHSVSGKMPRAKFHFVPVLFCSGYTFNTFFVH